MAGVEQDELFKDATQSYPCIYDVRNAEFMVTLVKENAWKAIAETLQQTGEMIFLLGCRVSMLYIHTMTVCLVDVKQRWKALRDHYMREIHSKTLVS